MQQFPQPLVQICHENNKKQVFVDDPHNDIRLTHINAHLYKFGFIVCTLYPNIHSLLFDKGTKVYLMRLSGKVALITGAAHGVDGKLMGFGGAAAWLFTKEGATVIATDIDSSAGKTTASQIRKAGGKCRYLNLDVTNPSDWNQACKTISQDFGQLDILVNNAGAPNQEGLETTTMEAWEAQVNVHCTGTLLGMQAVIPMMRKSSGGSIINVASIYGVIGSKGSTAYHTAKGGVVMLTKASAVEYAPENIRVNSILPGFFDTPFLDEPDVAPGYDPNNISEKIPLGRFGLAHEVASGMVFLASDESSYITGVDLAIDGGMSAI